MTMEGTTTDGHAVTPLTPDAGNAYESDALFGQYCEAHYGSDYFGVENFSACCARIARDLAPAAVAGQALDLGCAVGRASFELARRFAGVAGVDMSSRFIQMADTLKHTARARYRRVEEGDITSEQRIDLAAFDLADVRERVFFHHGDAIDMAMRFRDIDLVLAANLIDRLPDPGALLAGIHRCLKPGGVLVLASPYSWDESHTPRTHWLGGFSENDSPCWTLDGLHDWLGARFEMIGSPQDVPFVIRETRRKFQHSISQLTCWRHLQP